MVQISVIIPVHNGRLHFQQCAAALAGAVPPPFEVIVVADGRLPADIAIAQAAGFVVLGTPDVRGPAHARNVGAQAARGTHLLFLDADVLVPPGIVGQITQILAAEGEITAVFGSYDATPTAPNFLSQYKNLLHHFTHQNGRVDAFTFWSGCGVVRRDVFLAMGGFDDGRYPQPAIEDIELGYRLRRAGHAIRLDKSLQVKHLKRWRLGSLLRSDIRGRAWPWALLILQTGRANDDLNLSWTNRLSVLVVGVLVLVGFTAVFEPMWWWLETAVGCGLLWLNRPLYLFFGRERGWWFALRAILWHWFAYFYSGVTFVLAWFFIQFRRLHSPIM